MTVDRRSLLGAGAGLGALVAAAQVASAGPRADKAAKLDKVKPGGKGELAKARASDAAAPVSHPKLQPNSPADQSGALQAAIDHAASSGLALYLPGGRFRTGTMTLRTNSKLVGEHGLTVIEFTGDGGFLTASHAANVLLQDIGFDGALHGDAADEDAALLHLSDCTGVVISRVTIGRSAANGLTLERCAGRVEDCTVTAVAMTGIRSVDAAGLEILHNHVADCANNGIQVWRSVAGEDGTIVSGNRIERILSKAGGSGENGNGINVFRAGSVLVANNRISDCAYTAVRGNAASNIQIIANSCARLGEVALYAEFSFEGAVIANNVIDGAATGISVTNFNGGGRLAVVQGNLIRNLVRRELEPEDKRGEGITVEADTIVTGNVIEGAQTSGIKIGWGAYMRNCIVTQNLIRNARAGILITADPTAGSCLVTGNMIAGAKDGAIRAMDHGKLIGPDLMVEPSKSLRVNISGNVVG